MASSPVAADRADAEAMAHAAAAAAAEDLKREAERLRAHVAEQAAALQASKEREARLEEQVDQLHQALDTLTAEADDLQQQLDDSEAWARDLAREREEVNQELAAANERVSEKDWLVDQLKNEVSKAKAQQERLERDVEDLEAELGATSLDLKAERTNGQIQNAVFKLKRHLKQPDVSSPAVKPEAAATGESPVATQAEKSAKAALQLRAAYLKVKSDQDRKEKESMKAEAERAAREAEALKRTLESQIEEEKQKRACTKYEYASATISQLVRTNQLHAPPAGAKEVESPETMLAGIELDEVKSSIRHSIVCIGPQHSGKSSVQMCLAKGNPGFMKRAPETINPTLAYDIATATIKEPLRRGSTVVQSNAADAGGPDGGARRRGSTGGGGKSFMEKLGRGGSTTTYLNVWDTPCDDTFISNLPAGTLPARGACYALTYVLHKDFAEQEEAVMRVMEAVVGNLGLDRESGGTTATAGGGAGPTKAHLRIPLVLVGTRRDLIHPAKDAQAVADERMKDAVNWWRRVKGSAPWAPQFTLQGCYAVSCKEWAVQQFVPAHASPAAEDDSEAAAKIISSTYNALLPGSGGRRQAPGSPKPAPAPAPAPVDKKDKKTSGKADRRTRSSKASEPHVASFPQLVASLARTLVKAFPLSPPHLLREPDDFGGGSGDMAEWWVTMEGVDIPSDRVVMRKDACKAVVSILLHLHRLRQRGVWLLGCVEYEGVLRDHIPSHVRGARPDLFAKIDAGLRAWGLVKMIHDPLHRQNPKEAVAVLRSDTLANTSAALLLPAVLLSQCDVYGTGHLEGVLRKHTGFHVSEFSASDWPAAFAGRLDPAATAALMRTTRPFHKQPLLGRDFLALLSLVIPCGRVSSAGASAAAGSAGGGGAGASAIMRKASQHFLGRLGSGKSMRVPTGGGAGSSSKLGAVVAQATAATAADKAAAVSKIVDGRVTDEVKAKLRARGGRMAPDAVVFAPAMSLCCLSADMQAVFVSLFQRFAEGIVAGRGTLRAPWPAADVAQVQYRIVSALEPDDMKLWRDGIAVLLEGAWGYIAFGTTAITICCAAGTAGAALHDAFTFTTGCVVADAGGLPVPFKTVAAAELPSPLLLQPAIAQTLQTLPSLGACLDALPQDMLRGGRYPTEVMERCDGRRRHNSTSPGSLPEAKVIVGEA